MSKLVTLTRQKMTNKTNQKSKSGDNSTTVQAETVNINQGLTYTDVKDIALDVFNSNFLQLSKEALTTAVQRAEEITNDFIERLKKDKPDSLEAAKDPGFQNALYEAQKSYAKTGDKDMADVLVDILVDRVEHKERDLKQIVLDESISVIPKLTTSQLDTLTIIFLLKYSRNFKVNNLETLKEYLEIHLKPFSLNLSKEISLFQHLEFAGCGSIGLGSSKIEGILKNTYKGLFFQGFTKEQFEASIGSFDKYNSIVVSCLNAKDKWQFNAISDEVLETEIRKQNFNDDITQKIKNLFNQHMLPDADIKDKLIDIGSEFMNTLLDVWDNSAMKNMTLTSVGIAIAQANFRRKTGITLDLSIWIK